MLRGVRLLSRLQPIEIAFAFNTSVWAISSLVALFTTSMTFDIRICVSAFPSICAGYRRQLIQFHLLKSPVLG